MLVIYVDDFKLAANEQHMSSIWKLIRARIDMGDPTPVDRFTGCLHRPFVAKASDVKVFLENQPAYYTRPALGAGVATTPEEKGAKRAAVVC